MAKVSVIMPAYNAAGFISAAIASVRAQTLADWELIIVDDCSSDETCACALAAAGADPRIRLISADHNGGVARARNLGNRHAQGEWIAVLDADDLFEPERLETLVRLAEAAGLDMIADNLLLVPFEDPGGAGSPHLPFSPETLRPVDLSGWLDGNRPKSGRPNLGYLKPLIRRDFLLDRAVTYRAELRVAEDCWLVAELLAAGARFCVSGRLLYRYAVRPASLSRTPSPAAYAMQRPVYADFLGRYHERLSPAERAALRRHEQVLRDAEAFEHFAAFFRARRPVSGLGWLMRRPGALRFLAGPILARLRLSARRGP